MVQHSEVVMDSPNPTSIIQILENVMNLIDSECHVGETIDDQRQPKYMSDYEQHPLLNTMTQ